ncbi:MAG TPA: hypothetical protein VK250_03130 [Nitrososphaeraceae archaeon]|nr:hypothetical protein [Nitrososphaeraceae archaeon]
MNRKALLTYWVMGLILVPVVFSQAFAAQMEAFLIPQTDKADPVFTSIRFLTIKYEPGSELSKIFNGTNERISFKLNSSDAGMNELQRSVNEAILVDKNSPIQLNKSKLEYTAQIRGEENRVAISYKIKFMPEITNFVLPSNNRTTAVDLDWRSVVVPGPLTVSVPEYGKFDINYPMGLILAKYPEAAQILSSSEDAKKILQTPLLDYEEIGLPMDRWHFLFDPTGSQASAAGSGYAGEGGTRVVSVFSLGESSLREGTHTAVEASAETTINGSDVTIRTSNPPPSAQIQIGGFAKVQKVGGGEVAFVTPNAPEGTVTSSGDFPIQVLLILGGMMGAVAVLVLVKARKK